MQSSYTTTKFNSPPTPSSSLTRKYNWDIAVTLWLAFGIAGLALNVLEFTFLVRKKKYVTQFGVNLLSLSIADALACLSYCLYSLVMISIYAGFTKANSSTYRARAASQILIFTSITTSFTNIVLIAIQRLCAVLFPYIFSHKFTIRNSIAMLVIAWVIGVMYCVGFILSRTFAEVACYQIFIVGAILMIIYCVITYRTGLKHGRRGSIIRSNHNKRILLHSIGVTIVFVICNFPYAINFLFFGNRSVVRKYFYALLLIRPLVDPVVYLFLYKGCGKTRVGITTSCHTAPARTGVNETNH